LLPKPAAPVLVFAEAQPPNAAVVITIVAILAVVCIVAMISLVAVIRWRIRFERQTAEAMVRSGQVSLAEAEARFQARRRVAWMTWLAYALLKLVIIGVAFLILPLSDIVPSGLQWLAFGWDAVTILGFSILAIAVLRQSLLAIKVGAYLATANCLLALFASMEWVDRGLLGIAFLRTMVTAIPLIPGFLLLQCFPLLKAARQQEHASGSEGEAAKGDPVLPEPVIRLHCPGCKRTLRMRESLRGKRIACPQCKTAVAIPPQ
jgi:hypothetical protein